MQVTPRKVVIPWCPGGGRSWAAVARLASVRAVVVVVSSAQLWLQITRTGEAGAGLRPGLGLASVRGWVQWPVTSPGQTWS